MPAQQGRKSEGFYFVVVDGVPPYCQWQELKDYLRDSVKVNPGYANVLKVNEDGTQVGFCPLRNKAEANKAFEYLVAEGWRGLNIRVSIVWKADLSSDQIERRRGPEQSRRRRATIPTPALASFASNVPGSKGSTAATPMTMPPAYTSSSLLPTSPATTPPPQQPQDMKLGPQPYQKIQPVLVPRPLQELRVNAMTSMPLSATQNWSLLQALPTIHSTPVLEHKERIYTDRQSIHISRLPYEIKPQDLKTLLSRFGQVSDISIKRGKEKRCSATAKYQSSYEASLAIRELNGRRFNKLSLVVRLDRSEAGSVSSALSTTSRGSDSDSPTPRHTSQKSASTRNGPLVVNGARGPGYRKNLGRDDDSESTVDSSGEEESYRPKIKAASSRLGSRNSISQATYH